jgi:hypothetical protein
MGFGAFCSEALDGVGDPHVGHVSGLGCSMHGEIIARAGPDAATVSEATTARPMAVFLSIRVLLAFRVCCGHEM